LPSLPYNIERDDDMDDTTWSNDNNSNWVVGIITIYRQYTIVLQSTRYAHIIIIVVRMTKTS